MKKKIMNGEASYIPIEILSNIFKRLPVKSLIRFQCVCQDWKNLIKATSFIEEHLNFSTQQRDSLLFVRNNSYGPNSTSPLCFINRDMQVIEYHNVPSLVYSCSIVGSSNGLLCLHCLKSESFILWNPATREILHVPQVEPQCDRISLVGFGFSPIVNDYKIVIVPLSGMVISSVHVFSLSTCSWKVVEAAKLEGLIPRLGYSFAFDGAIFWRSWSFMSDEKPFGDCLISFDIATESLTLIPIPRFVPVSDFTTFTVYEHKLALLCDHWTRTTELYSINLWVMEKCIDELGERWVWTKIVTFKQYSAFFPHLLTLWRNQFFWDLIGGAQVAVDEDEKTLVLTNLHNNEFKTLAIGRYSIRPHLWNYAESLVSLGNIHIEAFSS